MLEKRKIAKDKSSLDHRQKAKSLMSKNLVENILLKFRLIPLYWHLSWALYTDISLEPSILTSLLSPLYHDISLEPLYLHLSWAFYTMTSLLSPYTYISLEPSIPWHLSWALYTDISLALEFEYCIEYCKLTQDVPMPRVYFIYNIYTKYISGGLCLINIYLKNL